MQSLSQTVLFNPYLLCICSSSVKKRAKIDLKWAYSLWDNGKRIVHVPLTVISTIISDRSLTLDAYVLQTTETLSNYDCQGLELVLNYVPYYFHPDEIYSGTQVRFGPVHIHNFNECHPMPPDVTRCCQPLYLSPTVRQLQPYSNMTLTVASIPALRP